jgi:hypothetical protein
MAIGHHPKKQPELKIEDADLPYSPTDGLFTILLARKMRGHLRDFLAGTEVEKAEAEFGMAVTAMAMDALANKGQERPPAVRTPSWFMVGRHTIKSYIEQDPDNRSTLQATKFFSDSYLEIVEFQRRVTDKLPPDPLDNLDFATSVATGEI